MEHVTIVSSDKEEQQFLERLQLLQIKVSPPPEMARLHVHTFSHAFRRARHRVPELETHKRSAGWILTDELESRLLTLNISAHWLEGLKKVYGCVAFGAPSGVCFMMDAESFVIRNSLCHAAATYLRSANRSVLVEPHPYTIPGAALNRGRAVETSRRILGGVRGDAFGEYYTMNNYHWLWPVDHVRGFAVNALRGLDVLQDDFLRRDVPMLEDTFYHYVYPRRHELGYKYVSINERMKQVLGPVLFNMAIHSKIYTFEILCVSELEPITLECASLLEL